MQTVQFPHPIRRVKLHWRRQVVGVADNMTELMALLDGEVSHMLVFSDGANRPEVVSAAAGFKLILRATVDQLETLLY